MAAVSGRKRVVYSKIKLPLFTHPHDDPNPYAVICSRVHATWWQLIVTTSLKTKQKQHEISSEDTCSEFRFIRYILQSDKHWCNSKHTSTSTVQHAAVKRDLSCPISRTRDPRDKHSFIMSCQDARGSMSRCWWFNRRQSDTLRPSTTTSQIYNSQPASGLPIICHY